MDNLNFTLQTPRPEQAFVAMYIWPYMVQTSHFTCVYGMSRIQLFECASKCAFPAWGSVQVGSVQLFTANSRFPRTDQWNKFPNSPSGKRALDTSKIGWETD